MKNKYGELSYQDGRNDWYRSGHECFLIELAKWGLGERDWMPNVNFFSKVVSDGEGRLSFVEGASQPGASVSVRMEMDALLILNTCRHPLDPDTEYVSKEVLLEVFEGGPVAEDDECRCSHPENGRAFRNTEDYLNLGFLR